jgi:hypothetical protein
MIFHQAQMDRFRMTSFSPQISLYWVNLPPIYPGTTLLTPFNSKTLLQNRKHPPANIVTSVLLLVFPSLCSLSCLNHSFSNLRYYLHQTILIKFIICPLYNPKIFVSLWKLLQMIRAKNLHKYYDQLHVLKELICIFKRRNRL